MANLNDVPDWQAFWVHNGTIFHNVYELLNWLRSCSDESFRYHVNRDNGKNDFAAWIRDCIGDRTLASSLVRTMEKEAYARKIEKRLAKLQKLAASC